MQLYYNGFIPFCVYTTYFTLPKETGRTFKKNNYDTKFFINRTDVALTNVKKFEIENVNLEDNVGSSVVNIIKEMIN